MVSWTMMAHVLPVVDQVHIVLASRVAAIPRMSFHLMGPVNCVPGDFSILSITELARVLRAQAWYGYSLLVLM